MVYDDTMSVVKAITRWLEFYKHESCGKCTPCREGTYWITGTLEKFQAGSAQEVEVDTLEELCGQILGRSFCALGDAAATPYPAALKYFRDEFTAALNQPPDDVFDPTATMIIPGPSGVKACVRHHPADLPRRAPSKRIPSSPLLMPPPRSEPQRLRW
jgi:NADH-quinone oxidoreductase subunit F